MIIKSRIIKTKFFIIFGLFILAVLIVITDDLLIGRKIDSYEGVDVYYNGLIFFLIHGSHYSSDGYYFGKKWQCVEFVRRFLFAYKNHKIVERYGNAVDYFDAGLVDGKINEKRGMVQYVNGGSIKPQKDDILVMGGTKYGHIAIITEVTGDRIETIQQNKFIFTRAKYKLEIKNGKYFIRGLFIKPVGWLRTAISTK